MATTWTVLCTRPYRGGEGARAGTREDHPKAPLLWNRHLQRDNLAEDAYEAPTVIPPIQQLPRRGTSVLAGRGRRHMYLGRRAVERHIMHSTFLKSHPTLRRDRLGLASTNALSSHDGCPLD